jgi:hypothetical protein
MCCEPVAIAESLSEAMITVPGKAELMSWPCWSLRASFSPFLKASLVRRSSGVGFGPGDGPQAVVFWWRVADVRLVRMIDHVDVW